MKKIPNLPIRKEDPPHVCFEQGRQLGLYQAEQIIDKINSHRWLHDNFLKRQERGCMDEEAFVFTLDEIKAELKKELQDSPSN